MCKEPGELEIKRKLLWSGFLETQLNPFVWNSHWSTNSYIHEQCNTFDHLDLIRAWFLFYKQIHLNPLQYNLNECTYKPSDRLSPVKGVRRNSKLEGSSKHQALLAHWLVQVCEVEGSSMPLTEPQIYCGLLQLASWVRPSDDWHVASWVGWRLDAPSCSGSYCM